MSILHGLILHIIIIKMADEILTGTLQPVQLERLGVKEIEILPVLINTGEMKCLNTTLDMFHYNTFVRLSTF